MNKESLGDAVSNRSTDKSGSSGQVLCFVSAKGGTGKTILSAAAAYALAHSGMRVVAIDTDFSTRGLSLFLLGSVIESVELRIQSENCLADSILEDIPVEDVKPLKLVRGAVEYNVIIANKDVFRGGKPDARFLGARDSDGNESDIPIRYCKYLRRLCERLTSEYDYVVLDTRGGYDFSGAAAATFSDGYVVVLEADKISIDQFGGLRRNIEDYAARLNQSEERNLQAILKGFIVNKAIHSVDETFFPDALARAYDGRTFGTIPIDKDAIRAYQKKNIPQERYPDSDFSYYSLLTIERMVSPAFNWLPAKARNFEKFKSFIKSEWRMRQRIELAQQAIVPVSLMLLAGIFVIFYFSFKQGASSHALRLFSIASAVFVMLSITGAMLSTLALLRTKEFGKPVRYCVAGVFLLSLIGLGYVTGFDIPNTFSESPLLQRVQERDQKISQMEDEKNSLQRQVSTLTTENEFLKTDKGQLGRSLTDAQQQLTDLQDQISTAKSQFASVKRDRDAAQTALSATEQRATTLQQKLDDCQRRTR